MEAGLINLTQNKAIAHDFKACKSLISKARGLMFSKKRNLIFIFDKEKKISLHMLFVFFPVWAVYLDKGKKAIYKKKLYPFISCIRPEHKAKYILELVKNPAINEGDKISWQKQKLL
ncbi:DUF192 domain-containing protein [Candidatus Woesearchaeota archaeon]|nr:DUF192 domain-containing protein [Candidatus Woesearchaeota archaeon]